MIGSRIKELRLKNKITLKGLNKLTGLAVSNITRIEQNQVNPSVGTLEKIAIALNCKQTDFFKDDSIEVIKEPVVSAIEVNKIHSFTVAIIEKLIAEGDIKDKNDISQEMIDTIKSALILDSINKKRH